MFNDSDLDLDDILGVLFKLEEKVDTFDILNALLGIYTAFFFHFFHFIRHWISVLKTMTHS